MSTQVNESQVPTGSDDLDTEARIFDAALRVFARKGRDGARLQEIADEAGIHRPLLHYYFRTMADLFLAVFRRRAEEGSAVLTTALQSPQPLWALWRFSTAPEATRLTMEFMGLANHRKALRSEIAYHVERFRDEQSKAIADALRRRGIDASDVPPVVWTVFATGVSQAMVPALGMDTGHAETFEFCEQWLRGLEGEPLPAPDAEHSPSVK